MNKDEKNMNKDEKNMNKDEKNMNKDEKNMNKDEKNMNKDQTEKEGDSVPSPRGTQRDVQCRSAECSNDVSESSLEKMFGKRSDLKNAQGRSYLHEMNPNDGTRCTSPKNIFNIWNFFK